MAYERCPIETAVPDIGLWSRKTQLTNWRLSIRDTKIFGHLLSVRSNVAFNWATGSIHALRSSSSRIRVGTGFYT
jgi:hypothetical protein